LELNSNAGLENGLIMRKLSLLFLALALPICACAENIPQPEGWVNDFAGVISQDYKGKLDAIISELEEKTSANLWAIFVRH